MFTSAPETTNENIVRWSDVLVSTLFHHRSREMFVQTRNTYSKEIAEDKYNPSEWNEEAMVELIIDNNKCQNNSEELDL